MSFVSYAQNFEDVMLWRALKHVRNGFYIDVGANDPTIDSVTKSFYDQGWSGINIEPLISHHAALQQERPRDINLQCAAGEICGEIELWECDIRGWATADKSVIALHEANGYVGSFQKVPVLPLSEICNANVKGEIHFLKIDVEGFEKAVIEGMDFSRFRPWILVVEAARPNSTEEVYEEWESIVLSNNYLLGYADGLNRFYVASERSELLNALRYPPNIFDEFIQVKQLNSELCAQQAEAKAQQAETKAEQAEAKAQQAETKAEQAEAASSNALMQLYAVYESTSWQITAPVRKASRAVIALLQWPKNIKPALKSNIKSVLSHGKLYTNRRPKLKVALLFGLNKLPYLNEKLVRLTDHSNVIVPASASASASPLIPLELADLSPRARQIYHDLKIAIENNHKKNR